MAMYSGTNRETEKKELVNRMILKQYDQLLDMCEQTKSELAYLERTAEETDFAKQLEIKKTRELIASIEKEIAEKVQEANDMAIKNRHQQLLEMYDQIREEVSILEDTALGKGSRTPADDRGRPYGFGRRFNFLESEVGLEKKLKSRLNLARDLKAASTLLDDVPAPPIKTDFGRYSEARETTGTPANVPAAPLETALEPPAPVITSPTPAQIPTPVPNIPKAPSASMAPVMPAPTVVPTLSTPMASIPKAPTVGTPAPNIPTPAPTMPTPNAIPTAPTPSAPASPSTPSFTPPSMPSMPGTPPAPAAVAPSAGMNTPPQPSLPNQRPFNPGNRPGLKTVTPGLKDNEPKIDVLETKKNEKIVLALNIAFYIFLALSILLVFLFGINDIDGTDPRSIGQFAVIQAPESTLQPYIMEGDLLITRRIDQREFQIGDWGVFMTGPHDPFTINEVVAIEDDLIGGEIALTLGDPNTGQTVLANNQIGRIAFYSAGLGSFATFYRNNLIILVIVKVAVLVGIFVWQYKLKLQIEEALFGPKKGKK